MVMLAACNTDVELCYADEHPHRTAVKYEYNWSGKSNDVIPDSMYVIAYRVVNQWKASMVVNSKDYRGYFLYNGPETSEASETTETSEARQQAQLARLDELDELDESDEPEEGNTEGSTDPSGDTDDNGSSDSSVDTGDEDLPGDYTPESPELPISTPSTDIFSVRTGSYKFITFSMNSTELIYDDVVEYMLDETNEKSLQDVYVKYKVYQKTDEKMERLTIDWQDYNAYRGYIWHDVKPVMFDTIASKEVPTNTTVTCKFAPKPITQQIDVYFSIKKKMTTPFRIDSVLCEMAGIPCRINVANGYLDISETAKVMFRTDDITDTDTDKGPVKVHGQINVPSVVSSSSPTLTNGPGIMQVLIFASVEDSDGGKVDDGKGNMVTKRLAKKIQGKINLYNTLHTSNLLTRTDDGRHAVRNGDKGVINVVADIVIDGTEVEKNNDETGGIDQWIDCNDDIIVHI